MEVGGLERVGAFYIALNRSHFVISTAISNTDQHVHPNTTFVMCFLDVQIFIDAISCENLSSRFPTRPETNWAVQPQKMARGLKFRI